MSYLYTSRKREPAASDREPKRNTAPDQARSLLPGRQAISGEPEGQSRRLDAAMQARMSRTFGDLSAVRDWQPPVRETAPVPTEPYTGPVTHTLSDTAPSPAAAGPMQAMRKKGNTIGKKEPSEGSVTQDEELPSRYSDDFSLLNSQQGTKEQRKGAYDHIALDAAANMTVPQRKAITQYIGGSEMINTFLRGKKEDASYPMPDLIPELRQQAEDISAGIQSNPLPGNVTTYKGITDTYFAMVLQQLGLKKAVNDDGSVNHEWLNKNQKKLRKTLVGSVFHDEAYTSTSTEKEYAQFWSRKKAQREKNMQLQDDPAAAEAFQIMTQEHPELTPGAHLITINMPKGARASFVDRVTDGSKYGDPGQREVLADKGSSFRISDLRKRTDSDSYELVMELLAEEEGKKRKKK